MVHEMWHIIMTCSSRDRFFLILYDFPRAQDFTEIGWDLYLLFIYLFWFLGFSREKHIFFGELINGLATDIQSCEVLLWKTYVINLHYIQKWTSPFNTWDKYFTLALLRIDHYLALYSHVIKTHALTKYTYPCPSPIDWSVNYHQNESCTK